MDVPHEKVSNTRSSFGRIGENSDLLFITAVFTSWFIRKFVAPHLTLEGLRRQPSLSDLLLQENTVRIKQHFPAHSSSSNLSGSTNSHSSGSPQDSNLLIRPRSRVHSPHKSETRNKGNMTFLYLLAGENLELAEAELSGLLKSQSICRDISRNGRLAETPAEPVQLKRLALTHEVSRKITEFEKTKDFKKEYAPEESFAVRTENLTNEKKDTKSTEEEIGKILKSKYNCVDLENPNTVVKDYIIEEKVILGEMVEDINRGIFKKRKNQNRPFSSPVSLDPKLARTLVNLSGVKPGEHLLDPFCGTGGILIEAGLCGIDVAGTDIDQEMVKGCRKNLEEYGIINHDIRQESAEKAPEAFDKDFDAIVTDLPYGRSSRKTEDIVEKFMNSIKTYDCRKVIMWNKDTLNGRNPDFSIDVHSSLTRYIYIID